MLYMLLVRFKQLFPLANGAIALSPQLGKL
jgi:hypothetical protein